MGKMNKMIDIHNHILIDVDDGPKTKEDAIALLKQANDEGVTEIIATPHHLSPTFDNAYENVQQKLNQLSELQGQEIRISDQVLPQLRKGEAIGLNHSRYLLIEFPSRGVPHYANRLFFELQSEGYIPIIAHPERNKEISQNLDVLYNLINQGALAQLTSSSLQGIQGKKIQKISIQMIENNLVHFIASDAHHESQRPFIMKSLYNNKKLKKYEKNIENLINNAKYIVNDEDVIKKQPTQNYNDRKLFGLF